MSRPALIEAQVVLEQALAAGFDSGNMDPARMAPRMAEIATRVVTDTPPKLRMSYGNGCAREKWFAHNMPDSATPRDRFRLIHAMGDLWEIMALEVLRTSLPLPWSLEPSYDQATLENFGGIEGHTDGALFYKGEPYAIIDPKFKNWTRTCMWWEPRTPKGVQQKPGDRRQPTWKWGEPHQAANYVWTEREKGLDFLGFMWVCGFRDDSERFHVAWMTADELRPWYDESRDTFLAARGDSPPPPCHPDRDQSPCMVWVHKGNNIKKVYCDHYDDCLNYDDQWKVIPV